MGSNAFVRFLLTVTAVALAAAAAGGVVLTLRAGAAPSDRVEYAVSRVSGMVALEAADDPGPSPFTPPVAADLGLDELLLPLPPLNADAIESPHHRGSSADLLAAGAFGHRLVQLDRAGAPLTIGVIGGIAHESLELGALLDDLIDIDGDGLDDDGRLTLTAADGSAACLRVPVRRMLAEAQGVQLDGAIPVSGYWWSPYGPCGAPESLQTGSDVRVGTTSGVYGASLTGDVCDVGALEAALEDDDIARQAWVIVLGVDPASTAAYLDKLTPVILLRDTAVTDHLLEGGRILSFAAILERGSAVLIDETGVPRVRCLSGSPLRTVSPIPSGVSVEGTPWSGFSLEQVQLLPAALHPTNQFVLVDVHTGLAIHRAPGITGTLTRLAGPLYSSTSG